MDIEVNLFSSNIFLQQIQDLFLDSFVLNISEINQKFEIFNKVNNKKIKLHLNKVDSEIENFTFLEINVYKKEIIEDGEKFYLELSLEESIPLDIEDFLFNVKNIIKDKLIIESPIRDFNYCDDEGIGIWVYDTFGSLVIKNKLAKKIIAHKDYSPVKYGPQICCIDEDIFLVVSDDLNKNNYYFFYAFLMSDKMLRDSAEKLLKEISIEASILSHDLKNPITGIKLGAELLKMDPNLKGIASEILNSVNQCEDVIKIFLDFYKDHQYDNELKNDLKKIFLKVKRMFGAKGELIDYNFGELMHVQLLENESLFVITLYILLNDLLSSHLHQQKVELIDQSKLWINVSFVSSSNVIKLGGTDFCRSLSRVVNDSSQKVFFKSLFELNKLFFKFNNNEVTIGRLW